MGEILTIFVAVLLRLPLPLIAIQILWINLVTDGLPALALSMDPEEPGLMRKMPRKKTEKIINPERTMRMIVVGMIMGIGTLGLFQYYLMIKPIEYAQTIAFTSLMMYQMFNVMNSRSETESILSLKNNYYLWLSIASSIVLQIIIIYSPLNALFGTMEISIIDWIYITTVASSVLIIGETYKGIKRITRNKITEVKS
jgi:Ca2+-transporting ATPase